MIKKERNKNIILLGFILISFVLFCLGFSSGDVVDSASNLEGNGQELLDKMDTSNYAWDYWKDKFLQNKIISGIDNVLTKISPAFFVLTGEDYSFSLVFLFVFVLFICFATWLNRTFKMISIFSNWVSMIISLGLAIILGQIFGIYGKLSRMIVSVCFSPEKAWLRIIIIFGFFLAFLFISKLFKSLDAMSKKNKEKLDKEKERLNRQVLDTQVNSLGKALDK